MGICWSCLAGKSTTQAPVAAAAPIPDPDPDHAPSSVGSLIDGDSSFVGSSTGNGWFSMATSNFSTWMSQASGAIAAIWGEDNEFPVALDDEALPDVGTEPSNSKFQAFTFEQLRAATFDFRTDMVLGKGGFGNVYKGWLREKLPSKSTKKRPIAIKKLDSRSKQGFRQWRTEVGFLARLSHPSIIKLVGYCRENEELLIVYEFMQKGSLNYHLFGKNSDWVLAWETRLKIAVGMAQGLAYLHAMERPIIFRDFKSSNVLLDESYNAKISDFGLAKWGPTDDQSHVAGHLMGTMGYTDPYFIMHGELYVKSDVFSFGVVLLELLTGLRSVDKKRSGEKRSLLSLVPSLSDRRKLKKTMDSRLEGKYAPKQALQVAMLAVRCVEVEPQRRPSMKEVAETLQLIQAR